MYRDTCRYSGFAQLIYRFKFFGFMSPDIFAVNKDDLWINYLPRLIDDMNNIHSSGFMIKKKKKNSNINLSNVTSSQLIGMVTLRLLRNHYTLLTKGFDIEKFYSILTDSVYLIKIMVLMRILKLQ